MSCWAVIVAAGRGTRAGLGQNKVFQPLEGRTVLLVTHDGADVDAFDARTLSLDA